MSPSKVTRSRSRPASRMAAASARAPAPSPPLANGASYYVRFLFGIRQTGAYGFAIIPDTLPAAASGIWIVSGQLQFPGFDVETLPAFAITGVERGVSNVLVDHLCAPGVMCRLQSSTSLGSWRDIGSNLCGTGNPDSFLHSGAAGPAKQLFRLRDVR
jgi:hypothetical protein